MKKSLRKIFYVQLQAINIFHDRSSLLNVKNVQVWYFMKNSGRFLKGQGREIFASDFFLLHYPFNETVEISKIQKTYPFAKEAGCHL
jgi:hypothetical protein